MMKVKSNSKGKVKNALFVVFFSIIALLVVSSCSTTVALTTLVPAEVNVSGYKTIAVQSTQYNYSPASIIWRNFFIPIRGSVDEAYIKDLTKFTLFEGTTPNKVSSYASEKLVKAIDKGFFTIKSPTLTDSLITVGKSTGSVRQTLMNNNVDALLTSSINYMEYDEYIYCEPIYATSSSSSTGSSDSSSSPSSSTTSSSSSDNSQTIAGYRFYLYQSASISLTYSVVDVENNVIIGNDTLNSSTGPIITQIGHTDSEKAFVSDMAYFEYDSATSLFDYLIDGFVSTITKKLSPHYETAYFDFMPNKPKVESLKEAYTLTDNGNYRAALNLFVAEYNKSGHTAAGYNAAILYYALGQYDDALVMAYDVYKKSGNSQALGLYYNLKSVRDNQLAATEQIESSQKSKSSSGELVGF